MTAKRRQKGVTLIEMVMTIVIVGILAGIGAVYIKGVVDLWDFWSFHSDIVSQGRIAEMRMARDIRQVKNDTSVLIADRSQLQFKDANDLTIGYSLNGANLMRNSDILASGVTNLTFSYFNATSSPLTPLPLSAAGRSDISLVGIVLTIVSGNQNKTLATQVYPRNF
jgi:prepilin-type N-terminal cleavage/methylation domain-containing protein